MLTALMNNRAVNLIDRKHIIQAKGLSDRDLIKLKMLDFTILAATGNSILR